MNALDKSILTFNNSNHSFSLMISVAIALILIGALSGCSTSYKPEISTIAIPTTENQRDEVDLKNVDIEKDVDAESKNVEITTTSPARTVIKSASDTAIKNQYNTALPTPKTTKPTISTNVDRQPSGTLKLAVKQSFNSLDPHQESSSSFAAWGPGIVYERIMKFNNSEQTLLPSMETICDICQSWKIKNLTTFNFYIRDDRTWNIASEETSNKVTAFDIKYSFERMRGKRTHQTYNLNMISDIKATSSRELTVNLVAPDADFLKNIAHGNAKIISKHHTQNYDDLDNGPVIGSGPWELTKFSKNSMSFLEASFKSVNKPSVNRIEFHIIPDSQTRLSAYLAGLVDIYNIGNSPAIQQDLSEFPTDIKLKELRTGEGIEIAFNSSISPFNIEEIRKSAFYSIMPQKFNFTADPPIVSLGFKVAANSWIPKPILWLEYFSDQSITEETSEHLKAVNGQNINIEVGDYGSHYLQSAELVSEQLSNFGFKTSIQVLNRPEYSARASGEESFHIIIGPPVPHFTPNSYLLSVLHSDGRLNTTGLRNKELDILIEKQSMEYDRVERSETIRKINEILFDEAHRFMPVTKVNYWTWQNYVGDFFPNFEGNEYSFWERVLIEK